MCQYESQGPSPDPNGPPPPQEDPTHDVPVYPEQDPTPGRESDAGGSDVDEDDLDPQAPHSPPDGVLFDENRVVG